MGDLNKEINLITIILCNHNFTVKINMSFTLTKIESLILSGEKVYLRIYNPCNPCNTFPPFFSGTGVTTHKYQKAKDSTASRTG